MVKRRATIIISGDVQDVGFRGKIMRIGHKSGLTGVVENLSDGTVRIMCEGEEKTIKSYLKLVKAVKDDVEIDDINIEWGKTKGTFKGFTIEYSDQKAEMAQGFATAGKKLDKLRVEMHAGFSDLKRETVKTHGKLDGIDSSLGDALVRYDTFGKKMISIETEMKEFTKQITRLVDHLTETKK